MQILIGSTLCDRWFLCAVLLPRHALRHSAEAFALAQSIGGLRALFDAERSKRDARRQRRKSVSRTRSRTRMKRRGTRHDVLEGVPKAPKAEGLTDSEHAEVSAAAALAAAKLAGKARRRRRRSTVAQHAAAAATATEAYAPDLALYADLARMLDDAGHAEAAIPQLALAVGDALLLDPAQPLEGGGWLVGTRVSDGERGLFPAKCLKRRRRKKRRRGKGSGLRRRATKHQLLEP